MALFQWWVARSVFASLVWRKAQHLHFIHASGAMSRRRHASFPPMTHPDFNLLITLDVLLAEGSVARAAKRLHLSPSAEPGPGAAAGDPG